MMATLGEALRLVLARYARAGQTVYGGQEPDGEALARAYRYWRERGEGASESILRACQDMVQGRSRWPRRGSLASYQNGENERGGRWIEDPSAAGLRFVGFADEIAGLRHSGWYDEPDGEGDLYRGAVYQMPARDGCPVYVEAVKHVNWKGEDVCGSRTNPAIIYLGERHLGERGEEYPKESGACRDCARGADSEAERIAERERGWREAWNSGRDIASKLEEAEREAKEARALARSIAGETCNAAAHCWREIARDLKAAGRAKREARKEIADSPFNPIRTYGNRDKELRLAFFEGLDMQLPEEESESCG